MAYTLDNRLVVGVASSALFDLSESDRVFRSQGEDAYRQHQQERLDQPLQPGIALSFVRRLLNLNSLSDDPEHSPLVEVVLLSRNDPDTGLRVLRSIQHHGLSITRAIFRGGGSPYEFIPALNISLFLSGHSQDVQQAIAAGYPAGEVLPSEVVDDENDPTLRIAFDFDGVLADDESEKVFHDSQSVAVFNEHETSKVLSPHNPGPLKNFLVHLSRIQKIDQQRVARSPEEPSRLRISIVTARGAPSHERAINTLKSWGVMANEAYFMGGVEKARVLQVLRPHIFFDDQSAHLEAAASVTPSVHIPFGIKNSRLA